MSLVTQFLTQIRQYVRAQDGPSLRSWLQLDSNASPQYQAMAAELRASFNRPGQLDAVLDRTLSSDNASDDEVAPWPGFVALMRDYLLTWRDIDFSDLVSAHELLSGLLNSCATAFAHPSNGAMLLQTSMALSESLARVTMMLSRRPDLTRQVRRAAGEEDGRKSLAESSAEIIQKIFTTCLTDRATGRFAAPEGKKVGVYMFANLVLKLLFACRRTHLAKMLFVNISTISPPLSLYPAAQRVTFLYYLGRFNLANNHYLRASLCLQEAYLQTPAQLVSHRTRILTYLIPCNMLLGRFPSAQLLGRPEAQSLGPVFLPLCQAVRRGDFVAFQAQLREKETWLFERGLLLVLTHRLRPLLWRSLSRRVFVITYVPPTDATSRRAATLDLTYLHAAATFVQRRLEGWSPSPAAAVGNTTLAPPKGGTRKLRPNEGLIWGNAEVTMDDVELMVATLIQQGLMHGFVAHGQGRFAIIGAKAKGSPLVAGWPAPWQAIRDRRHDEVFDLDDVPGWFKG